MKIQRMERLLVLSVVFLLSYRALGGSEDPPIIEVCQNDSQQYKYEKFINLKDLEIVYQVSVTLQDGMKADKDDIRVLVGRIHPHCDANLRTYVPCAPDSNDYLTFRCDQQQLFSRIIVQSKNKISEVNDRTLPPTLEDLTSLKQEFELTKQFRVKTVQKLRVGVSTMNIYKWPSALYLTSPYSLPIGLKPQTNKIFMGAVATGREGSGGKIVVCNDRKQYSNMVSNRNLYDNLVKWMTDGKLRSADQTVVMSSEILQSIDSDTVLVWDAHTVILNKRELDLLENRILKRGLNVILFINSWYYNRDVEKLNESKLVKFLTKFGIFLTNEYLREERDREIPIDWGKVQNMRSGLEKLKQMSVDITAFKENIKEWMDYEDPMLSIYRPGFLKLYRTFVPHLETSLPCRFLKTEDPERMAIVKAFNILLNNVDYLKSTPIFIHPGDLKSATPLLTVQLEVSCECNREAIPTGYYLPADHTMSTKLLADKVIGWKPYVGYNFFDISAKSYYYKYPKNFKTVDDWFTKTNSIHSPFGGLVFIQCLYKGTKLKVELSNVVKAPFLDLRDSQSLADWPSRQQASAPWAVVAADSVMMTTHSRTVLNQREIPESLELFDKCNKYQHYLVGEDVDASCREFISFDYQGLTGWMGSGYPISAYLTSVEPGYSAYPFNLTGLLTLGSWGLFHEMGHNRQSSLWTSTSTRQVTNNILTLACQELIAGETLWERDSNWHTVYQYLETKFVPFLRKEKKGKALNWGYSPWVTLAVYIQLQHNFGWEFYKQIFRSYTTMTTEEKNSILSSEQVNHDVWFKQACLISSYNLAPLYKFWRVPISQRTLDSFKHLPAFFPDDFVTQAVPEITENILREFPNAVRKPNPVPISVEPFVYNNGNKPPQVKILEESSTRKMAAPIYYGTCKNRAI